MLTDQIRETLLDLARACRVLAMNGHEDKTLGHLSWRDPQGRGFWLKRGGIGLAEVTDADDFILVDFAGKRLFGEGDKHMEWPIHSEILRARPDVNVVAHTHPFYSCLFAATNEDLQPIAHEACYFGATVPRYRGTSFLINTIPLGQDLAAALGATSKVVLMNNHGLTFCGESVADTGTLGIIFEKACHQQLVLKSSGFDFILPPDEEVQLKARNLSNLKILEPFWAYYLRMLDRQERKSN